MNMAESSRESSTAGSSEQPVVMPLTRRGYVRLAKVEWQIGKAVTLDGPALLLRARRRDEAAPDFLAPEALVYFIRGAIRNGEEQIRDNLFRELLERCNPYFRNKFRGFGREDREDLQGEVQCIIIEDLFARDDRSDFMQVRFWTYLERRCIDACRPMFRQAIDTESLDTGYLGDDESEGLNKVDQVVDEQLSSEEFAMISEGLRQLPPRLQHVFWLRHYFGLPIGSDKHAEDEGKEMTIAVAFGCSGRTVRNWLKEANRILAKFREEHNGE